MFTLEPHRGCVNTIESVLSTTDGVSDVHVELDAQKASITSILSIQELVALLDELGMLSEPHKAAEELSQFALLPFTGFNRP